jgi:hypothetical protein
MSNNWVYENIFWLSVFQFIFLRFYLKIQKPKYLSYLTWYSKFIVSRKHSYFS